MIEVMDVRLEQTNIKCDLISLSMHSEPTNWFKQIIIPIEDFIILGGKKTFEQ